VRGLKAIALLAMALPLAPARAEPYPPAGSLIHWRSYAPEAFKAAKEQHKPILVLISASWCHWCHEFETRSLETPEVAALLNDHFVPVCVDADRRPDVVARYPGRGLPETVIVNPAGGVEVAVPGAIPKEDLVRNLRQTVAILSEAHGSVVETVSTPHANRIEPVRLLTAARQRLEVETDPLFRGFSQGAKLPKPEVLLFLLGGNAGERRQAIETMEAVTGEVPWLKALGNHGLYDPVEGGFFRYATRRNWSEPHDEKLLGLNAEILRVCLAIYRQTGDRRAKAWATSTIGYMLRTLRAPPGGFYGSQAADEAYYRLSGPERRRRQPPSIDRHHYADSSAKAAIALFEAARVLRHGSYRAEARRVLEDIERYLRADGAMAHDWSDGRSSDLVGMLDDQAWAAMAFQAGYATTHAVRYRSEAEQALRYVERNLRTENGYRLHAGGEVCSRQNGEIALAFAQAGPARYEAARLALRLGLGADLDGAYGWQAARILAGTHAR